MVAFFVFLFTNFSFYIFFFLLNFFFLLPNFYIAYYLYFCLSCETLSFLNPWHKSSLRCVSLYKHIYSTIYLCDDRHRNILIIWVLQVLHLATLTLWNAFRSHIYVCIKIRTNSYFFFVLFFRFEENEF